MKQKLFTSYGLQLRNLFLYLLLGIVSSLLYAKIPSENSDLPSHSEPGSTHKRKHRSHKKITGPEEEKRCSDIKSVKKLFSRLDELYASVIIKVQTINAKGEKEGEELSDLYTFLSGSRNVDEVAEILERDLHRALSENEISILSNLEQFSLTKAIRAFYRYRIIDEHKAHAMLLKNAPLEWSEILKLVDLGAVHTKSGYLLTLKTGKEFGDPIKLFAEFHNLANEIIKSGVKVRSPSDLLLRPLTPELSSALNNFGPNAIDTLSDARLISEIRRHFVFLSSINLPISFRPGTVDFRPNALMSSGAPVNLIDSNGVEWALLKNLNAVYANNYYFLDHNASLTNSIMLAPFGLTYWGNYNWTAGGIGWWANYTDKYLGIGGTYTVNFANGTFWSSTPNYVMLGAMVGAWRNYLTAGISVMTLATSTVGVGASVTGTITREHEVRYNGIESLDNRIPEIRGQHKIEIDDLKGVAGQVAAAVNFSNLKVPIMMAFRVGAELTARRIYRTHVELKDAQRMLTESEIPGILFLLGKDIEETKLPSFMEPLKFKVGDEFIETKITKLSGAFVVGLQSQLPIGAVRAGTTLDVTAEFELALRVLPEQKIEVSIEPKRIYEMGVFSSILNTLGVGVIESMSLLKKQSFIFDFTIPEAVAAYFELIDNGKLPTFHDIYIHPEERGPEYLLTEFRAQNKELEPRGIVLNYVEQVRVSSEKLHAGFSSRMLSGAADAVNFFDRKLRPNKDRINFKFDGIDWEFMGANAMSIATNGSMVMRRSTSAYKKSHGQGTSGRFNKDLFVTHRRVHMMDEATLKNNWDFDSLMIAAQYEDTLITGDQENSIAREIDHFFSLGLGEFKEKNSRQPRTVHLERELSVVHLQQLLEEKTDDRIILASQRSGVSQGSILSMLRDLKNKHPDWQALRIKRFMEQQPGVSGFSAIHQLLGAKPEDIFVRTDSSYISVVKDAKKFIMLKTRHLDENNKAVSNFVLKDKWKNRRANRKIFNGVGNHLRHVHYQLNRLDDDQYFVPTDANSKLMTIYGPEKLKTLSDIGVRQSKEGPRVLLTSARKELIDLLDLPAQGYGEKERKKIYKMVGEKRLDLMSLVDGLEIKYKEHPLSISLSKKHLRKRFSLAINYIDKVNNKIKELNDDAVTIKMDKEFFYNQQNRYSQIVNRLSALVAYDHLDENDRAIIEHKIGEKILERYRKIIPISSNIMSNNFQEYEVVQN